MGISNPTASSITPNRCTYIQYDPSERVVVSSPWSRTVRFGEAYASSMGKLDRCCLIPGIGVQLAARDSFLFSSWIFGSTNNDDCYRRGVDATIADGFEEISGWRKPSEFAGIDDEGDLAASGGIFYRKRVGADDLWSAAKFTVAGIASLYGIAEDNAYAHALDPVFKTNEPVQPGQAFAAAVRLQMSSRLGNIPVLSANFPGPVGWDQNGKGTGLYQCTVWSSGNCKLFEKCEDGWVKRAEFSAVSGGFGVGAQGWSLEVLFFGNEIHLGLTSLSSNYGGNRLIEAISQVAITAAADLAPKTIYRVSQTLGVLAPAATQLALWLPRFLRPEFFVQKMRYQTEGIVYDDLIQPSLGTVVYESELRVEWYGDMPTGTFIDMDLLDVDGAVIDFIPASDLAIGTNGRIKRYDLPYTTRAFRPRFTLTGDGEDRPTLKERRLLRDGETVIREASGEPVRPWVNAGEGVSILAGTKLPNSESASFTHVADKGELDFVKNRDGFLVRIGTCWDDDAELPLAERRKCILFEGYVDSPTYERRIKKNAQGLSQEGDPYNSSTPYKFDFMLDGKWLRLAEQRMMFKAQYSWGSDPLSETGAPWKVSDVLKVVLGWCGFLSDQVEIADSPIRLWPTAELNDLTINANTDLLQFSVHLAREYLGGALVWDPNAGEYGKWLLIIPPRAPFENLATFTTGVPPDEPGTIKRFGAGAYAETEWPVFSLRGQSRRPVANDITVGAVINGKFVTIPWRNPKSLRWHPGSTMTPEEGGLDWLDREVSLVARFDALPSEEALNFFLGRLQETIGKGYRLWTFNAPLVLVPHEEDEETKRRPLRFGDPILLIDDGDEHQCIITNVNIAYEKDHRQLATYECREIVA